MELSIQTDFIELDVLVMLASVAAQDIYINSVCFIMVSRAIATVQITHVACVAAVLGQFRQYIANGILTK